MKFRDNLVNKTYSIRELTKFLIRRFIYCFHILCVIPYKYECCLMQKTWYVCDGMSLYVH